MDHTSRIQLEVWVALPFYAISLYAAAYSANHLTNLFGVIAFVSLWVTMGLARVRRRTQHAEGMQKLLIKLFTQQTALIRSARFRLLSARHRDGLIFMPRMLSIMCLVMAAAITLYCVDSVVKLGIYPLGGAITATVLLILSRWECLAKQPSAQPFLALTTDSLIITGFMPIPWENINRMAFYDSNGRLFRQQSLSIQARGLRKSTDARTSLWQGLYIRGEKGILDVRLTYATLPAKLIAGVAEQLWRHKLALPPHNSICWQTGTSMGENAPAEVIIEQYPRYQPYVLDWSEPATPPATTAQQLAESVIFLAFSGFLICLILLLLLHGGGIALSQLGGR